MSKNKQLVFDYNTNEIIEEQIKYWKTYEEVPEHIKKSILSTSASRVIYDSTTNKYHCSKCLKLLDDKFYCTNCSNQCVTPSSNDSKYVINTSIKNIREYDEYFKYFVFDLVDDQVLIYILNVNTYYNSHIISMPYQTNDIYIDKVYLVTNNGVIDLLTNNLYLFEEYAKNIDENIYKKDILRVFETRYDNNFLYTDNLPLLENIPFYQYSNIWKLQRYFEKETFSLASLTCYPIYYKQFEYLVKMKLYNLATTCPYTVKDGHNFKEAFRIDKKYYSFMKEIDINIDQLEALRIYPTTDIDLINFIAEDPTLLSELLEYVDINKLKIYLEKQKLESQNIYEYYDYIMCCRQMGLDLKDNQVLFPKHFAEQHDKLTAEMIIATNPEINSKIHSLSNFFSLNIYEDEQYIIFPADSIESLIDESSQMSNCVRNYCTRLSNNECQIYFMRYKDNSNKSLVTIEVRDGKIVQARTRFNGLPNKKVNEVLKKWEKQIIPIVNEKD